MLDLRNIYAMQFNNESNSSYDNEDDYDDKWTPPNYDDSDPWEYPDGPDDDDVDIDDDEEDE